MSASNYMRLLEHIKQLKFTKAGQEPPASNLNYPDLVKLSRENAKLKTRIKQLGPENILITQLYVHYKTEM